MIVQFQVFREFIEIRISNVKDLRFALGNIPCDIAAASRVVIQRRDYLTSSWLDSLWCCCSEAKAVQIDIDGPKHNLNISIFAIEIF